MHLLRIARYLLDVYVVSRGSYLLARGSNQINTGYRYNGAHSQSGERETYNTYIKYTHSYTIHIMHYTNKHTYMHTLHIYIH